MTLFIDIENKKLVQSLTSDRSVPAPIFMQGDNEPLEIFLLQKGGESLYEIKQLVVGTDFLRVAIARFKGYPKSLTYAAGYALNPNGAAEVVLPLNTTAIENAVQESEYITAFLEVEYSNTAGRIITILQTACRVKNDLIENAPAVELQEQFYDKVYTDAIFSKKSANLSDLADKSASRKNLDVYAKSEVYNKSEVDVQEAKNLKKASNLADVADKSAARTNLDVPQKRELFKYMKCGIWSDTSLSVTSEYGATLGDDFVAGNCSTFLTIYLPESTAYYTQLYAISYADSGMFIPEISADGRTLKLGYIYQESESGGSEIVERTAAISKAIEYGDRIALTVDGRNFKLYKGIELVSSGVIPEELSITGASLFLGWKGLKQVMAYSNSLLLPLTSNEGKTSKINYSIEDFANGNLPPKGILNSRYHYFRNTFASSFTHNSSHSKGVGGAEIGGKKDVLKISLVPDTYNTSHEYELPTKYFSGNGMLHKIRFSIYLPTTNPNITKVQLRLGSIAPSSAGTIISKTDNIDKSGVILPKDEWQTVEMILTLKWSGAFKLYLYKGNNSYFKLEEESTDAVYLHSITCSCLQGFEGFFYDAEFEAILSEDVFAEVQKIMAYNAVEKGPQVRNKYNALLAGKAYCANCKTAMVHTYTKKMGAKVYRYYICSNATKRGWKNCPHPSLSAPELESYIVSELERISGDAKLRDEVIDSFYEKANAELAETVKNENSVKRTLTEIRKKISSGTDSLELRKKESDISGTLSEIGIERQKLENRIRCGKDRLGQIFADFGLLWRKLNFKE